MLGLLSGFCIFFSLLGTVSSFLGLRETMQSLLLETLFSLGYLYIHGSWWGHGYKQVGHGHFLTKQLDIRNPPIAAVCGLGLSGS